MASQNGDGIKNEENPSVPRAPFDILNQYRSQVKRLRQGKLLIKPSSESLTLSVRQKLSAETILELAKTRLIHFTSQKTEDHEEEEEEGESSSITYPFEFPSGLSPENLNDVEITFSLLSAAENFSNQKFDLAYKFLSKCIDINFPSYHNNNPLQRVVKYFAEALRERVDLERGKIDLEKRIFQLEESLLNYQPVILALEQKLPSQIRQFTAVQTILESVANAKRIHLIDFGIKIGTHWSVLIEGLSNRKDCSVELLKITSVGTSKDRIEETGRRISSYAESINFPLIFKTVVSELKDLKKDLFEFKSDEVLALYCGLHLWTQLAWPNHLKSFLHCVKKLDPCVMVVNEFEASTNTSNFMDRFREALSFNLAIFDCVETCLKEETMYRKIVEEVFFQDMIRNIIGAEEDERFHRHEKIGFWRGLFGEFELVEMELSESSWYQARLLIERNSCWDSCSLSMDGKCMIVGWKGTPLQSVSAWKVRREE